MNIADFGAVNNLNFDNKPAIQRGIDACIASGGGRIHVPVGNFRINSPLIIDTNLGVQIKGQGNQSVISTVKDVSLIRLRGAGRFVIEDLGLIGNGIQGGNGPVSTQHSLDIGADCVDVVLQRLRVVGGLNGIQNAGVDTVIRDVMVANTYGNLVQQHAVALWMDRCKLDNQWPVQVPLPGASLADWTPNTNYGIGAVRKLNGFWLQCIQDGRSGATLSLKNYWTHIIDGTTRWLLACQENSSALNISSGSSEVHITQSDFTGAQGRAAISVNNDASGIAPFYTVINGCVLSQAIMSTLDVEAGYGIMMSGNEIAPPVANFATAILLRGQGEVTMVNNTLFGSPSAYGIKVTAGSKYAIVANCFKGWLQDQLIENGVIVTNIGNV